MTITLGSRWQFRESAGPAAGRVRWKRFAAIAIPAAVGAGALVFMTAQGAIASSFAVSGSSFKVSADSLSGTGFVQYGGAGPFTLRLTAGTGAKPVKATDLVLDVEQLNADATFSNIEVGRDAGTLSKGPDGDQGTAGMFGQQASRIELTNVKQVAWATTAGTFKLSDLSMKLGDECF